TPRTSHQEAQIFTSAKRERPRLLDPSVSFTPKSWRSSVSTSPPPHWSSISSPSC
ncbi:hypothetical protein BGX26_001292, partial [Mortierella sp. AD094]